ncbi:MAG: Flp pilus assembly protein CpaB [Gemmatimonadetes bacterium]|nr:Flp pilus assembly protein CpaB [Gemmatimonadota bacterium]
MRAVSFRVDEVVQVAGFVVPGTHVDLVLTITPPGETQPITKIVMQNLQVLTAAQSIQKDADGKAMPVGVVTVLVTPEQAEKLILATQQGRIQLALRNTLDVKDATTSGIRPAALLSGAGPAPSRGRAVARSAAAPAPRTNAVEVIQGGVRSLKTF